MYTGNQRPDPKDLENVLADHCKHWKSIGLQLGLRNVVLNRVESDHRNQQMECFRVTLEHWLNSNVEVTWKSLELAITNANRLYLGLRPLENGKNIMIKHMSGLRLIYTCSYVHTYAHNFCK